VAAAAPGTGDQCIAAATWPVRGLQRILELATVPLQGEHMRRRPLRQVQAEGLQIQRRERFKAGIVERLAARKPATGLMLRGVRRRASCL
jgi:hypothetical protein